MKILHISNDYAGSKVYRNLIERLDHDKIQQIVYTAIRSPKLIGKNAMIFKEKESSIIYSQVINNHLDRVLYRHKIKKIIKNIEAQNILRNISLIHAHTWYSDGGVAFELYRKYKIPYVITIRNTDLNIFFKYFIHLRRHGYSILENAKKIVFISEVYYNRFENLLAENQMSLLEKCMILPNGVDEFWLDHVADRNKNRVHKDQMETTFLYVGRFTKGKNLPSLIKAISDLNTMDNSIKLTLVGGLGNDHGRILRMIASKKESVQYLGLVSNREELREIYRAHDFFVMPSKGETFGLVYVEALLQGLPILYTANEGIDGMYLHMGEKVTKGTVRDIKQQLLTLMRNKSSYDFDIDQIRKTHDWRVISHQYITIYKSIL